MPFVVKGVDEFSKRINRYYSFKQHVLKPGKSKESAQVKKQEATSILQKIPDHSILVLFDENGKSYGSISFANKLEQLLNQSKKHLIFIVGGAFGFDASIKDRADLSISLSDMTFSHQLIRLIFCEQLYRACTIIRGEKYHNV